MQNPTRAHQAIRDSFVRVFNEWSRFACFKEALTEAINNAISESQAHFQFAGPRGSPQYTAAVKFVFFNAEMWADGSDEMHEVPADFGCW